MPSNTSRGDETWWTISARPVYDQDFRPCLQREEIEDAEMLASYPGVLIVRLGTGTSRDVAEAIAACLRSLPGEPLKVGIALVDRTGIVDDGHTPHRVAPRG